MVGDRDPVKPQVESLLDQLLRSNGRASPVLRRRRVHMEVERETLKAGVLFLSHFSRPG